MLGCCGGNCGPGGKQWQPTAGFMASVTCGLIAEDRDQLQESYGYFKHGTPFTLNNL